METTMDEVTGSTNDLPARVDDAPAGEPGRDEGPLGRLFGVFVNPRRTFASMRERPRFLLPLIILLVVQTGIAFLLFHSGVIAEQTVAKMEEQGKDERSIEAVQNFFEGPGGLITTVVTAPFATAIGILAGSAVLFFMANLMLGARLRFQHYLSAVAFAGVVQIVDQLIRIGLILHNRTFDVRLGVGNLFGEEGGFLVRALDIATDPLFLWGNAVCAIGVSTYAKKGFGFGALAVLPGMLLAILLSANR
jgi:hypothetical protein